MSVYVGVEGETTRPKELVFPQDFTQDMVSVIDSSTGEIIGTDPAKGETYYSGSTIFFPPKRVGNRDAQFLISNYDLDTNKKIAKISFDLTSFPIDKYTNKTPTISVLTQLTEVVSLPITSLPLYIEGVVDLRDDDEGYITIIAGDSDGGKDIEDSYRATIDNLKVEVTGVNETVKAGVARKVTKIYAGVEGETTRPKELVFPQDFTEDVVTVSYGDTHETITTDPAQPVYQDGANIYFEPVTDKENPYFYVETQTTGYGKNITKISFDLVAFPFEEYQAVTPQIYVSAAGQRIGDLINIKSLPIHFEQEIPESIAFTAVRLIIGNTLEPAKTFSTKGYITNLKVKIDGVTETVTGEVARKVKKGYVGVGGVARPFFSAEAGLEYYGTVTPLSEARFYLAATTVGNYALFGGGEADAGYSNTVDAYDYNLTRSVPTTLITGRYQLAATTVRNYALFGGGSPTSSFRDTVVAYNSNLTRRQPEPLLIPREALAATTVGNYALFGGGFYANETDHVDAYSSALSLSTPTALSEARQQLAATTVGNYALFGGGYASGYSISTVDAYDNNLTKSTPTTLSIARNNLAATSVGNYALFGGGIGGVYYSNAVDAYDNTLTRSTPIVLSVARAYLAATTVGNYALFGGGNTDFEPYSAYVDVYDKNLTRSTNTNLTARKNFAATTVGKYALFGGGVTIKSSYVDTVDVYSSPDSVEKQCMLYVFLTGYTEVTLVDDTDDTQQQININAGGGYQSYATLKQGHSYSFRDPGVSILPDIQAIGLTQTIDGTMYLSNWAISKGDFGFSLSPKLAFSPDIDITITVHFN